MAKRKQSHGSTILMSFMVAGVGIGGIIGRDTSHLLMGLLVGLLGGMLGGYLSSRLVRELGRW